jgi:ADP-heptose:LPS heptosyltransferase
LPLKQTVKHLALSALAAIDRKQNTPLAEIKSFLILQHEAPLGSAIHTTPLIPALRTAVPTARIVVAGSGYGAEIFRNNPGVDAVLEMPNPFSGIGAASKWLHSHLSGALPTPFATLTPQGNERTAIALAAWQGAALNRVGYTLAPELFRASLSFDPTRSQIANNLRIIEALGHAPAQHFEPQVFFSEEDVVYAHGLLPGRDRARPLAVFVTQTSVTQRKGWRAERFVAAARFLHEHFGAQIVFVGMKSEREAIDAIPTPIGATTWNVAGQTTLQQLSALLSLCNIGLTLDTGTLHLGRAVGLPMAVIAPAWSLPIEWLPLNNPRYIIFKNLDMPTAPEGYIIDEVSVDEVCAALARLMPASESPAHPAT